ncbi:MAG: hypothetical protein O7D94_08090 [Planctomycetota bacterium]|nr:hypothetical protein [Planctomycetota bacterium]MCZ6698873.1 hypothetical protein [Planctomycetota bacterium]
MLSWLKQLDDLLRGRKTAPEQIPSSDFPLPLGVFVPLAILLSGTYGFFMGWYALFAHDSPGYLQLLACMLKLPALFLLTLVVTLPSLYVFNAIIGCRLTFVAMLRLLVGAIVVNVAVAASLGPILAFFTVSTTSYPFMIVLNVVLLTIAGFFGLAFLLQTLRRLAVSRTLQSMDAPEEKKTPDDSAQHKPGAVDRVLFDNAPRVAGDAKLIFHIWIIIYGLVGAQMGWLLRPFVGSPDLPFQWFRPRQGNFFLAVVDSLASLLGRGGSPAG